MSAQFSVQQTFRMSSQGDDEPSPVDPNRQLRNEGSTFLHIGNAQNYQFGMQASWLGIQPATGPLVQR